MRSRPLLELANYHILGRVFYYVPYYSPLPAGRVLATFGGLMAAVELLNALGVALAANTSSSSTQQSLGSNLVIAAIAIQLIIILTFFILAGVFHRRCAKAKIEAKSVKTVLSVLYASMVLIFVRCIYRLVEHASNNKVDLDNLEALRALSPLLRYEWSFYIFEATLMLINSALWNVWHPGRFLPKDYHIYLGRDGTEVMGEKEQDPRTVLQKAAHVLTFGIMYQRKSQTERYQELSEYPSITRLNTDVRT